MIECMIGLIGILFCLVVSIDMRCRRCKDKKRVEGMESPLSRAIQETVGYAGGIYITLVTLSSFLQVELPERIALTADFRVEPLAFTAVVLTIVQPLWLSVRESWNHSDKEGRR